MCRKRLLLIISISLVFYGVGCHQRSVSNKEEFNIAIEAVNASFEIEMPSKVDQLTVYRDGWQGHGFYVYFEIPSEFINQIKTERHEWEEVPKEHRFVSSSVNSEEKNCLHERVSYLFNWTKTFLKIHNNDSDRIQWFYYSDEYSPNAPEKTTKMMISENQNGIIRCYFLNTDIRDYEERGKLYSILTPEHSIVLYKNLK